MHQLRRRLEGGFSDYRSLSPTITHGLSSCLQRGVRKDCVTSHSEDSLRTLTYFRLSHVLPPKHFRRRQGDKHSQVTESKSTCMHLISITENFFTTFKEFLFFVKNSWSESKKISVATVVFSEECYTLIGLVWGCVDVSQALSVKSLPGRSNRTWRQSRIVKTLCACLMSMEP